MKFTLSFFCSVVFFGAFVQCHERSPRVDELPLQRPIENLSVNEDTAQLSITAELSYRTDDYKNAVREYSKLINLDSTKGRFFYRRGYSLMKINSYDSAILDFLRASNLDYKKSECYFNLGGLYDIIHQDSLAIIYLQKCLKIDPKSKKAKSLLKVLLDQQKHVDI